MVHSFDAAYSSQAYNTRPLAIHSSKSARLLKSWATYKLSTIWMRLECKNTQLPAKVNHLRFCFCQISLIQALQDFPVKNVEAFTKSTNPTFNFRFSFTLQLTLGSKELHRGIRVHAHNAHICHHVRLQTFGPKHVVQSLFGGVIFEFEFMNKFIHS